MQNFGEHFAENSVKEVVVNNPQAQFLEAINSSLQSDGIVVVRGQMSNTFFSEIWNGKAKGMEGYEVIKDSRKTGLSIKGHVRSDGKPLGGNSISLNEIILKKKS